MLLLLIVMSMDTCILRNRLAGFVLIWREFHYDVPTIDEMEARVGIEPASTALQAAA